MVFSKLQRRSCCRRRRALTAVFVQMFRLGLKAAQKTKATSINLTLAAVGLDAYELLRSRTSSLVHNGERRDANRAHLLEVVAPKRAADDIDR
jgi:hypothetical protein